MNAYIETYGCRMNICDSEVILSILHNNGYSHCDDIFHADVIILNCCSVRETGHEKTFERLNEIEKLGLSDKKIVIAGCFATLLDKSIFERFPFVDVIIGPDSYRKLPALLSAAKGLHAAVHENLPGEMYSDIIPKRDLEDKTTAAITIMKGCNQFCSYCIEPFTRGREESRDPESILTECRRIEDAGYKELTFVGHIIDRYQFGFAKLLEQAAILCPGLRIKYLSSHPMTYTDKILEVVKRHDNIMRVVHLPVQSGSDIILKRMNRGYSAEQFKKRCSEIRASIPDMSIITDIMVGFCGETEEDFQKTKKIVQELEFDDINIFKFSMRHGTAAFRQYDDDVPESTKEKRELELIELRDKIKLEKHLQEVGSETTVFNEGTWHKDTDYHYGRDRRLRTCIFKSAKDLPINTPVRLTVQSATSDYLICTCL